MEVSVKHFQQYKQIARLLWKYGRSDIVTGTSMGDEADTKELAALHPGDALPTKLADDLEAMGPTYVKLGQILSSRPDLLPEPYIKALSRFDVEPLAAASLGQVHSAALRDGRLVVVKVQRPGIDKQIAEDLEVLAQIAEWLDEHTDFGRRHRLEAIVEEFRVVLQQELNYEREAANLLAMAKNLEEFEGIFVPQPIADYSMRRVLTMDYVRGRKMTSLGPLKALEMPGDALAEELFKAYLKQVLVDGLFHADPHPGNVFLTSDHSHHRHESGERRL